MSKKIKVGLMLGGGGAKGSYQIGVIKALKEAKLLDFVKVISGTSIGAINTMLLMSKSSLEKMDEIWDIMNNEGIYGDGVQYTTKRHNIISLEPLYELLCQKVRLKKVRKSRYIGYATAAQMLTKQHNMLTQLMPSTMQIQRFKLNTFHEPHRAVLASASIPVLFGITHIDGIPYVDGGVLDLYPMEPLIAEGCNLIWAVAIDSRFDPYLYDNLDINIIDFSSKAAFNKNVLLDLFESTQFNSGIKESKYHLGYLVGKIIIKKMYDEGIIQQNKNRTFLRRKPNFYSLGLSKNEEKEIKEFRTTLEKEIKEGTK